MVGDVMRLKKVRGASEAIATCPYVVQDPKQYRGDWQRLFEERQPIHIEIGMGKGNFIIQNALAYPHINFIGIEKFDSVIVRAIEKLQQLEQELPNLKLIRMDAEEIESVFDHEIETIYLNFSDPWPKNRHAMRRLTSPRFLKRYETLFQKEKRIVMKTDNRKLFEYSLITLTDAAYHIKELTLDLYQDNVKGNIPTEYEERFANKGFNIYRMEVEKDD